MLCESSHFEGLVFPRDLGEGVRSRMAKKQTLGSHKES